MDEGGGTFEDRVWRNMERIFDKLDEVTKKVQEVREDQIAMKAENHAEVQEKLELKLTALEAKVQILQLAQEKRSGMVTMAEWAYKLGPWIVATVLAIVGWWRGWLGPPG